MSSTNQKGAGMSEGFIRYEERPSGVYARHCRPKRDGKRVYHETINIGVVIDKNNDVYKNRKLGIFKYTIKDGFMSLENKKLDQNYNINLTKYMAEKLIVDFGDVWFINELLKASNYHSIIEKTMPDQSDTLFSLILFKMSTMCLAYTHASEWYKGSYTSFLYPKASIESPLISKFLSNIGEESVYRRFFQHHLDFIKGVDDDLALLIDSTGLPNSINFDLTQVNNHNGVISNEIRLIYVVDRKRKLPVYFRYIAGNIVDVNTICTTFSELFAQDVNIKNLVADAGYLSEENINKFYEYNIPFLIRLQSNRIIYKNLVKKYSSSITDLKNGFLYGDRILYVVKDTINLYGHKGYAYILKDKIRSDNEERNISKNYLNEIEEIKEINDEEKDKLLQNTKSKIIKAGLFILISSVDLDIKDVLPLYYTRQTIEQTFDFVKNFGDLLPVRNHTEETFRGHMIVSFIITTILTIIDNYLKNFKLYPLSAIVAMKNLKAKVYDDIIIVSEPNKTMNELVNYINIEIPKNISLL
jgi:hypothetical protein